MNTFQAIDKFLTVVIDDYKMEARRVGNIAAEGCALAPYNLNHLIAANGRALGALEAQDIIKQTVAYSKSEGVSTETAEQEALPRIIRALESKLEIHLNNSETHIGTVKVLNDVLRSLRLEVEVVAAK